MQLLADAVERRNARRLLDELVIINRGTNADAEQWEAKMNELEERSHTGLFKIEPPPVDPNAPPPRPRPFPHQKKK